MKIKVKYPLCIDIFLKRAREKDSLGKRSKWFYKGGPEREEATEIFREAAIVSQYVILYKKFKVKCFRCMEKKARKRVRYRKNLLCI